MTSAQDQAGRSLARPLLVSQQRQLRPSPSLLLTQRRTSAIGRPRRLSPFSYPLQQLNKSFPDNRFLFFPLLLLLPNSSTSYFFVKCSLNLFPKHGNKSPKKIDAWEERTENLFLF